LIRLLSQGGKKDKESPKCIRRGETGLIRLALSKPICVEKFEDFRPLGRFFLRSTGLTVAYGIITNIFTA